MRRITVDIDFKNIWKILFYIKRIFKKDFETFIIKKSASKGFHFFIWTKSKGKRDSLRKYFGEDLKHLNMDKSHRFGKQTLFSRKEKINLNEWLIAPNKTFK